MTGQSITITLCRLAFLLTAGVSLVSTLAADTEVEARLRGSVGVSAGQVIDHDYFAAGPVVEISGTVNGDLYAAGGQVLIDGRVNGDVLVAGGRVVLSGHVAQNVRVAGGQVTLGGTVGRNVTVLGGNLELIPGAEVTGNLVAAGGNVHLAAPLGGGVTVASGSFIISNRVGGDVEAVVGSLRIASKADIKGRVVYVSQREAFVDPAAQIERQVLRRLPPTMPRPSPKKVFALFAGLSLVTMAVSFVSTLILGLLSLRFLPRYHRAAVSTLRERPWTSLGVGFFAAVVTPVVTAILFATILGIPLALILLAAYPIVLYWGRIFALHRIGGAICRRFRTNPQSAWVFVLGLVIYYLLALIPVIGWLVTLVVTLSGLGSELIREKGLLPRRKKTGDPLRSRTASGVIVLGFSLLTLGGCTVGITGGAVAVAALGAGTGEVVRAGTEYSLTGTAFRTFTTPLDTLYAVTRATLNRMAFTLDREETLSPGHRIVASAIGRTIEIQLEPLSPAVTRVELVVKRNFLRRDRATASEIITQIELVLIAGPTTAP